MDSDSRTNRWKELQQQQVQLVMLRLGPTTEKMIQVAGGGSDPNRILRMCEGTPRRKETRK